MELSLVLIVTCLMLFFNDVMAKERGRNRIGWFLFALIISPLLSLVLLWVLGDSTEKMIDERIKDIH